MNHSRLGELKRGTRCTVISIAHGGGAHGGGSNARNFHQRFMEMGVFEGAEIEILHEAPFGKDPIAIRVRGSIIALRRSEANAIWVAPQ